MRLLSSHIQKALFPQSALQAATILVAMASGKIRWPQLSRQSLFTHGKINFATQNQFDHGKNNFITAKSFSLTAKTISHTAKSISSRQNHFHSRRKQFHSRQNQFHHGKIIFTHGNEIHLTTAKSFWLTCSRDITSQSSMAVSQLRFLCFGD